ncbi:hypothetical protein CC78DRAFT_192608 [Lojkania enalia]|uniref:Uncharacterized protein n=1 Tax=Lojkania enalia TaxID=147567 RepID=A0A9P4TR91_9PLEO|nr:hypothetical protein CC78DRAFT_192608 [Didymosphaeria enalia]
MQVSHPILSSRGGLDKHSYIVDETYWTGILESAMTEALHLVLAHKFLFLTGSLFRNYALGLMTMTMTTLLRIASFSNRTNFKSSSSFIAWEVSFLIFNE